MPATMPPRIGPRPRFLVSGVVLTVAICAQRFLPQPHAGIATVALLFGVPAALILLLESSRYVFDRWLFGGRSYNHSPRLDPATGKWTFRNWGGNQTFTPRDTVSPRSLDELLETVGRHGTAGRKVRAIGGLHSWSACAVAGDVCLQMHHLDRVLGHDAAARTVTVEAGIQLRGLYAELDKRGLAIASIPNVDTIQLGGAIANATHGTNFSRGTMSSYVRELQIVVFQAPGDDPSQGKAELVTLRHNDPDPKRRAWFDAAVASFGSVGVIYAVTLECEEAYACFVIEHSFPFSSIVGRIEDIARKHYSAFISVATSTGICRSRVQVPIPRDLVLVDSTCLLTAGDLRVLKILLWAGSPNATTWLRLRKALNRMSYYASIGRAGSLTAQQRRRRQGVMSWRDAELLSRIFAVTATAPWINLEYAVPVNRADEAARRLLDLMRTYPVFASFCMRPVGPDTAGFLSPAKDRPTVFFDVGYHQALLHTGVYAEIETLLLECEGRCSWSRLFHSPAARVVEQYPQYSEFVRTKREMDPCNVFSNAFSDSILFPRKGRPS